MAKSPKQFRPMLSGVAPDDISQIKYPVLVSPKLDGIRCLMRDGSAVSRTLKPIPNKHVQECLAGLPDGPDGELIVGEPIGLMYGESVMSRTVSGVMSEDAVTDFTYHIFDDYNVIDGFAVRQQYVKDFCETNDSAFPIKVVPHTTCYNALELEAAETHYVELGYEGVMIRALDGPYKLGRSTEREGYLLKWKRFFDAEATVIDFTERMHNNNEATIDERGLTKRSTHKGNKTPAGTLGALVCRMQGSDVVFEVGTGFDDAQRAHIWANRSSLMGALVTYKYQELSPDGVPRFPVFIRFRDTIDCGDPANAE